MFIIRIFLATSAVIKRSVEMAEDPAKEKIRFARKALV